MRNRVLSALFLVIDGAPSPEYGATVEVGGRRYTERGAAPIGVVAAELVDLRRAIGWPVGVTRG